MFLLRLFSYHFYASLYLKLPAEKPTAIGGMTRKEIDAELAAGIASLKERSSLVAEDFDKELAKEFGI